MLSSMAVLPEYLKDEPRLNSAKDAATKVLKRLIYQISDHVVHMRLDDDGFFDSRNAPDRKGESVFNDKVIKAFNQAMSEVSIEDAELFLNHMLKYKAAGILEKEKAEIPLGKFLNRYLLNLFDNTIGLAYINSGIQKELKPTIMSSRDDAKAALNNALDAISLDYRNGQSNSLG